jgi:hypothetical protein
MDGRTDRSVITEKMLCVWLLSYYILKTSNKIVCNLSPTFVRALSDSVCCIFLPHLRISINRLNNVRKRVQIVIFSIMQCTEDGFRPFTFRNDINMDPVLGLRRRPKNVNILYRNIVSSLRSAGLWHLLMWQLGRPYQRFEAVCCHLSLQGKSRLV